MSSLHSLIPFRTQEQFSVTETSGTVMSLLPEAYHCDMLFLLLTCTLVSVSVINAFSQEGNLSPLHNPNLEGHQVSSQGYPSPTVDGCQPWQMGGHLPRSRIKGFLLLDGLPTQATGTMCEPHLPEASWFCASKLPLNLQNLPKQSYNGQERLVGTRA